MGVDSKEGMTRRFRHIAICVKGLRELMIPYPASQVNDKGLRVTSSSFPFLAKLDFVFRQCHN